MDVVIETKSAENVLTYVCKMQNPQVKGEDLPLSTDEPKLLEEVTGINTSSNTSDRNMTEVLKKYASLTAGGIV
jgi:hypothetical protein